MRWFCINGRLLPADYLHSRQLTCIRRTRRKKYGRVPVNMPAREKRRVPWPLIKYAALERYARI